MTERALTCRELIEFLGAYLDEELAAHERTTFDRHLAVCPYCVDYLESYRRTVWLGQSLAEGDPLSDQVPVALLDAILAARPRH